MQADNDSVDSVSVPGTETFPPAETQRSASPTGIPLGARLRPDDSCEFRVWAPKRARVELKIVGANERVNAMTKTATGCFETVVENCPEGSRYLYVLDGGEARPDPASRHQPDGVHTASAVVGTNFEWHDAGWSGVALEDYVVYELHVGTFTDEGTFDAAIGKLDHLKALGITVVELLPIGQFPGTRNWGYDGTYVNAVQHSYGGARGLKRFVDACHARGLAVMLDVVYNHLGPEGNYLSEFGPYFTDRYKTPWGLALNFDGPHSDDVRWFFIHNALQWIDEFHIDGLRVDAVHAIIDHSAEPFLQDLCEAVHERARELGRQVVAIAESDLNDPRVITPKAQLGLGFDSQWMDDYHHSLHTLLTGEQDGYYEGFPPKVSNLARVLTSGFLYIGQHSPYRGRKYGMKPNTRNGAQFVVSMQNHDQVGNRMLGERLTMLVPPEKVRLAAAAIILSPFIPMLFMGEEYGEKRPFRYFTSHADADLIEAVRNGRREEFDDFVWHGEPPDPQAEETFVGSKLDWGSLAHEEHASMLALFQKLIALRRDTPSLQGLDLDALELHADDERGIFAVRRWSEGEQTLFVMNFGAESTIEVPFARASWKPLLDTNASISGEHLAMPASSFGLWSAAS